MKTLKFNFSKGILTIFITLISISIKAQDTTTNRQKGNILVSGGALIHYTSHIYNGNKSTSFTTNITPKGGYFIIDNLVTGIEFSIQTSNETSDGPFGEETVKTTGISVLPFARYYLTNGLFAESLLGIGSKKTNYNNEILGPRTSSEIKTNTFGFRAGIGYAIILGEHIVIEPSVNYSWEKDKIPDASSTLKDTLSSIFLGINFTVFL